MKSDEIIHSASRGAANGLLWNATGILTRQSFLIASAILLARILGPENYAVVALAGVYTAFTSLLLDQGLTAPLISKKEISKSFVGAATTLNLLSAVVIAALTVLAASSIAIALNVPDLRSVLFVFAIALPLKAVSIAPRAILARSINFKTQAIVDVGSSIIGGAALLAGIILTGDYWAFVFQVVVVDICAATGMILAVKPPFPNLRLRLLRQSIAFGGRVLISNLLGYTVQNLDNILIGRYLGPSSLSYYSVAYRLVTMPVQLVGQIVSRVMFPVIVNRRNSGKPVDTIVEKALVSTSIVFLPLMAFISVSSSDIVNLILGAEWKPAALTLSIFAIAGARQAITTLNSPILMGMDRTDVLLKFSLLAATVQVSAIILGLKWGINGVALCYTIAGFVLTPVIMRLQKTAISMSYKRQICSVAPGFHCALWVVVTYLILNLTTNLEPVLTLILALPLCVLICGAVLALFHKPLLLDVLQLVRMFSNQQSKRPRGAIGE